MSAVSDYVAAVNSRFDAIDAANTDQETQLTGIADDVAFLKEQIEKLSNGDLSEADKALLAGSLTRIDGLATRVSAFKDALAALNAATERPPAPPV